MNQKLLAKSRKDNEQMIKNACSKLEAIRSDNKRITSIEVKVADMENAVDGKLVMMEEKINNL